MDILSEFSFFGTSVQMQRKFPYFKIHLTTIELPPNLQLEVNNVLCNDILTGRLSREECNRVLQMLSKWLIYSDKIVCSWIDTSIWQHLSVWKDIFKGEMYKITLQKTINWWSFTIDIDDRKHLEPELKEMSFPQKGHYKKHTEFYFEFYFKISANLFYILLCKYLP